MTIISITVQNENVNDSDTEKNKMDTKKKVKQSLYRPGQVLRGFWEVEDPRFQDNRHMKVVRLSALCIGHLYHPGNIPGTHFC